MKANLSFPFLKRLNFCFRFIFRREISVHVRYPKLLIFPLNWKMVTFYCLILLLFVFSTPCNANWDLFSLIGQEVGKFIKTNVIGKEVTKKEEVTSTQAAIATPCIPIHGPHCGPNGVKSSAWVIPDSCQFGSILISFSNACKEHDRCYAHSGVSRLDCDRKFREEMEEECKEKLDTNTRKSCLEYVAVYIKGAMDN